MEHCTLNAGHLVTTFEAGICVRCLKPLGAGPWWVTTLPHGEHAWCRDWSRYPSPFGRHVNLLRRLWRLTAKDIRPQLAKAGRLVVDIHSTWPRDADPVLVEDTFRVLRELRSALLQAGVDRKLCCQL